MGTNRIILRYQSSEISLSIEMFKNMKLINCKILIVIVMKKIIWLFPVLLAVSTATLWKRKRKFYPRLDYLGV